MIDSVGANSYFAILVAHATYSTEVHQSGFRPHNELQYSSQASCLNRSFSTAAGHYVSLEAAVHLSVTRPRQELQCRVVSHEASPGAAVQQVVNRPYQ